MALLKGTLDVLVLKTLSWGPMHGFEITRWLENRSGGRLDVTTPPCRRPSTDSRHAGSLPRNGAPPRTSAAPATTH